MNIFEKGLKVLTLFIFFLFLSVNVVSAQTWSPATNISNNLSNSEVPTIIEDDSGTLHTIWCNGAAGNGNTDIFYSYKPLAGSWSQPVNISQTPGLCGFSTIIISQDHTINVAWEEYLGSTVESGTVDIYYVAKSVGGDWSSPENIVPGPAAAYRPSVVESSDGTLHMTLWQTDHVSYYLSKPSNGSWSAPVPIYSGVGSWSSLAIDSNDTLHFVWQVADHLGTATNIYYLTKPSGGAWSGPTPLSGCTGMEHCAYAVIAASGNRVYLLWHKTINWPYDRDIYYMTKTGNSSWSQPVNITSSVGDDSLVFNKGLDIDSLGNPHVVWMNNTGGAFDVYYSKLGGGVWSTPINLSNSGTPPFYPILAPSIEVGMNDYLHVVWQELISLNGGYSGEIYYLTTVPENSPPTVAANGPYLVAEGGSVTLSAIGFDPEGGVLDYAWDLDNDGSFETLGQSVMFSAVGKDGPSDQTVIVQACDPFMACATDSTIVNITNIAPTITNITVPLNSQQVNTNIAVSATFDDPGVLDTHTATWTWNDGSTSIGSVGAGTVNGTHTYTAPGVYQVSLTVTDDDGGNSSASALQYVVIFDPAAGFVTGSGNFNSPLGAYTPNPSLEGKAHFGFSVKYLPGDTAPSGFSQFRFRMADLDFTSTSYEWLVISGQKSVFKGVGTINDIGSYTFIVLAIDGSPDRFRIKITDNNTNLVVYDNEFGAPETADPTTLLIGGSITIH